MATQRAHVKYKIPDGFESLLEGLTKEILRSQPENIYTFAADYFDSLINIRETTNTRKIETLVTSFTSSKAKPLRTAAISSYQNEATNHSKDGSLRTRKDDDGKNMAAVKIQSQYRGYRTRKRAKAATKIQANYRGHRARKYRDGDHKDGVKRESQKGHHGIRSERYSVELSSLSSEGSLVEYGDLEAVSLKKKPEHETRRIRQQSEHSSRMSTDSRDSRFADEYSSRSGATSVTDVEGVEGMHLYYDEADDNDDMQISSGMESAQTSETDMTYGEPETDYDTGPDVDFAAKTIQAGYRGMVARKKTKQMRRRMKSKPKNDDDAAAKIQAGYRGMKTRKLKRRETNAAITIQSTFKGYRTRQELQNKNKHPVTAGKVIDNTSDENKAAVRIQSTYRGFKTRKKLNKEKSSATTIQATYRGYRARKGQNK
ncbi:uncharacterized protein LOC100378057 [Saccoglossus kowalevskii]|uniref:Abnormal spindle-like microcephaly-associated protein homolog n=1 Tax=Saccoglossus kowalevskii TaxID=10224 RepID=A0ABM0GKL6_SACKO|nr:PREDICTED: abnormal spindle-like microcephaly-associated protein homolog [Saccoglossus kowalevskii]